MLKLMSEEEIERAAVEEKLVVDVPAKDYYSAEEREEIAEQNIKLVYYVANSFRTTGIDIEELISAGMLGYAKAIQSFDKNHLVKFSTYAINCIRNEILYFMRKENKHRANTFSMNTILSIDKNGNPFEMEDVIQDESSEFMSNDILIAEQRELLMQAIARLNPKEQYIIIYRYGILDGIVKTQKIISQEIQMSQANVSKLQKTSAVKLQRYLKELSGDRHLTLERVLTF